MESTAQYNNQGIFKQVPNYRKLYFYMKADTLVLLTDIFCKRFLSQHGDRTVDQMNQAARSGKQNIVEGCEAALTSSETEIKLVNVGRSSFQELREDYEDYLKKHGLPIWDKEHPRYEKMVEFCRKNNVFEDYKDLANSIDAEAFCNMAKSLCHITDRMFYSYLKKLEDEFLKYGGIRERMHAARIGYRQGIDERLQQLEAENSNLNPENERLRKEL